MENHRVDPVNDLGPLLLHVEKPARYAGGEYGRLCKPQAARDNSPLKTLIAFPDLYEIGMSNQALRILYNRLNRMEGIFCDRAFAPAPDFEELLRKKGLPLYGLDTGISLKKLDLLMFTLGYELGITNVFTMLDVSGIPLRCRDRKDGDPVVIMGGPCVSNPLPYSAFIDAFWIGEAEGGFFELVSELAGIKKSGGKRRDIVERLLAHPSIWAKGKERAVRAVDGDFSAGQNGPAVFPVPSMKVVHHHGSVEIMRGCPNGCRFCHAGYWYRPMRQKNSTLVEAETEAFVRLGGYREISLSSLSSGDYQYLDNLIDTLNRKFPGQHISFQLPSLRVSSFSLNLLDKISEVRKSGLTFAVETPADFWQMAINKKVSGEDVVSILKEARRRGWRGAKFYFMLGLPLEGAEPPLPGPAAENKTDKAECKCEEEEIAVFVEKVARQTKMHFNINVGTFVPKPHTPFQWAAQLSREKSEQKLNFLRARLKPQGHKVGVQDPLVSALEGILSRGDERAGDFIEEAYSLGCRLDSWTEYLKRDVWEALLEKHKNIVNEFLAEKDTGLLLPWACVDSGIGKGYFAREERKARQGETTSPCTQNCTNPCGCCNKSARIVQNNIQPDMEHHVALPNFEENNSSGKINSPTADGEIEGRKPCYPSAKMDNAAANSRVLSPSTQIKKTDPDTFRIIFSFSKQGSAVFQPHLGLLEIFSMAFIRANIPILYSQGFNPLPRLDIASPLSLGIKARGEIAAVDTKVFFDAERFKTALNAFLPDGLEIVRAMNVHIPFGVKKHSVSSLLWGYVYAGKDGGSDIVRAGDEKAYRLSRTNLGNPAPDNFCPSGNNKHPGAENEPNFPPERNVYGLERLSLLARTTGPEEYGKDSREGTAGESYFDVYRALYP